MNKPIKARIIGTGCYLPERVLSNHDLEKMVETSDEWIVTRTGMKERRIAREDEYTSDMGYEAALHAIEAAKVSPEEIDLILVATVTPDYTFPSTACLLQARLKAANAAAIDIQAACTGYIYALSQAKAYVDSGLYKNILVVAAEKLSSIINYKDRNTCVLFGDGASACIISDCGNGLVIRDVCLGADGELAELLILPAGGSRRPTSAQTVADCLHYLQMGGKETYKHAVRRMEMASKQCLDRAGLTESEISWIVPHQANARIIEGIAKRFAIPMERVYLTIHKYGNTSASSVGIALDELLRKKGVKEGENLLLVAFGAGLTWGASILTSTEEGRHE
jgi:3-oxoacyl-[acyl-carrier-protein] synthase III